MISATDRAFWAPREFPGTQEEAAANYRTHDFDHERCYHCDCRPWGRWASWPCGVNPDEVGYNLWENGKVVRWAKTPFAD